LRLLAFFLVCVNQPIWRFGLYTITFSVAYTSLQPRGAVSGQILKLIIGVSLA